MQKKLTIAVVTMNRAEQLREALQSCLACILPEQTEFIVVDNASTDNTEQIVAETIGNCGYMYKYYKNSENIGAGGGRNLCFSKAEGEYIYGMDDDAIVDYVNNPDFFMKAIEIMDNNMEIVSLATQVFDRAWGCNRQIVSGREIEPGIYKCKMFCGGSHFLRKSFYKKEPYLSNKYGYEELPPSLKAVDEGKLNIFCPDLLVIHQPIVNKWNYGDEKNHDLLINECAVPYAIKKMMYPRVVFPVIVLGYRFRVMKHLRKIPGATKKCKKIVHETIRMYSIRERIKVKTVIQMYRDFGPSIF